MALYEYRCPQGHSVEVFHKMDESPDIRCTVCGATAKRVISPPMIHTQYYFSPQVHGAGRPRHRPGPPDATRPDPAAADAAADPAA